MGIEVMDTFRLACCLDHFTLHFSHMEMKNTFLEKHVNQSVWKLSNVYFARFIFIWMPFPYSKILYKVAFLVKVDVARENNMIESLSSS